MHYAQQPQQLKEHPELQKQQGHSGNIYIYMFVHHDAEDVNKIMMLMQSLTAFMYFMLEPLLCASCCIFLSSLRSSGYEVLHGSAMPEVQGVRESVSTGFQKAWHCCTSARKYHEVSVDLETYYIPGPHFPLPWFVGCQVSDSASAAGTSFTEHMSQVEIRP